MIWIKRKIITVSMNVYCFTRAFSRISQNPKQTKTFPKPILSKPKLNQNRHQNYQNHIKTILSKPKPHQNQDFKTSFDIGACLGTMRLQFTHISAQEAWKIKPL
jgi:hypothetical protein